jgi:hypothetical protein
MRNIINSYKQLFLLKASPEALPYSRILLGSLILVLFITNVLLFVASGKFSFGESVIVHASTLFLSIFFLYSVLKIKDQVVRLHKLLEALFGVDVFFLALSILMLPLNVTVQVMLVFAFTFWSLAIKTHIFIKGFNLNVFRAILLMLAFEIVRHIPIAILIWPLVQQQGGA